MRKVPSISGYESMICRTRGEHVSHYSTDAVMNILLYEIIIYKPARYIYVRTIVETVATNKTKLDGTLAKGR
jgi:hypothetical protein